MRDREMRGDAGQEMRRDAGQEMRDETTPNEQKQRRKWGFFRKYPQRNRPLAGF